MTTPPTDGTLQALHLEIERMLGHCLLRLQQYERLLKHIVVHHEIEGPLNALESNRDKRIADKAGQSLGTLVGQLVESYVIADEDDPPAGQQPDDVSSFRMRSQVRMPAENYEQTKSDLRKLVLLRNNLVHHFIEQHDLSSHNGCRGAYDALSEARDRINRHFKQLGIWAEHTSQVQQLAAALFQSAEIDDFLSEHIAPDGSVDWPNCAIARALQDAAGRLGVEGWTSVAAAAKWIVERHPDQLPAKYGCSSWRQVVHLSQLFELRYREFDGQRTACYRAK